MLAVGAWLPLEHEQANTSASTRALTLRHARLFLDIDDPRSDVETPTLSLDPCGNLGPLGSQPTYQAECSGAALYGGQISSSRASVLSSRSTSIAATASSSCSSVRGPMIGPVTPGRDSSQARATLAGCSPISSHRSSYACTCSRCSSRNSLARPCVRRVPSLSFLRTPPSRPPYSGLHGMTPSP